MILEGMKEAYRGNIKRGLYKQGIFGNHGIKGKLNIGGRRNGEYGEQYEGQLFHGQGYSLNRQGKDEKRDHGGCRDG